jgi:hypothetical protein
MKIFKTVFYILSLFFSQSLFAAEPDSVVFKNGNYIVGEVKSMDRGVMKMETPFSDSDFAIEWSEISELYFTSYFLITLTDGRRFNGTVETSQIGEIRVIEEDGNETITTHRSVVFLDGVDKGFWSQLYASIDIGLDLTKANNFQQLSTRSTLGYRAERCNLDGAYNTLNSTQNDTDPIQRTDGSVGFTYFLPKDWYFITSLDFLSNTEQRLELRSTVKAGLGKYIMRTNRKYWGFSAGVNYNNENFSSDDADRNSMESFLGTELNLYDIGDLSLLTKLVAYPSLTESGRIRSDFSIDTKYEMPFDDDFYIKVGLTLNYDNQPVQEATDTDYVFRTGFGWQW